MAGKGSPEAKVKMARLQLNKKNLTPATRKHLEEKINENEALLKSAEKGTYQKQSQIDTGQVKRNIKKDKTTLEANAPAKFSGGAEKDKEHRRAQELAEKIKIGMPTDSEMKMCPPGMIGRHMKWSRENKEAIAEYKGIQRRLEPENPNAANIERLRRR